VCVSQKHDSAEKKRKTRTAAKDPIVPTVVGMHGPCRVRHCQAQATVFCQSLLTKPPAGCVFDVCAEHSRAKCCLFCADHKMALLFDPTTAMSRRRRGLVIMDPISAIDHKEEKKKTTKPSTNHAKTNKQVQAEEIKAKPSVERIKPERPVVSRGGGFVDVCHSCSSDDGRFAMCDRTRCDNTLCRKCYEWYDGACSYDCEVKMYGAIKSGDRSHKPVEAIPVIASSGGRLDDEIRRLQQVTACCGLPLNSDCGRYTVNGNCPFCTTIATRRAFDEATARAKVNAAVDTARGGGGGGGGGGNDRAILTRCPRCRGYTINGACRFCVASESTNQSHIRHSPLSVRKPTTMVELAQHLVNRGFSKREWERNCEDAEVFDFDDIRRLQREGILKTVLSLSTNCYTAIAVLLDLEPKWQHPYTPPLTTTTAPSVTPSSSSSSSSSSSMSSIPSIIRSWMCSVMCKRHSLEVTVCPNCHDTMPNYLSSPSRFSGIPSSPPSPLSSLSSLLKRPSSLSSLIKRPPPIDTSDEATASASSAPYIRSPEF
jgi:hypothetical protein